MYRDQVSSPGTAAYPGWPGVQRHCGPTEMPETMCIELPPDAVLDPWCVVRLDGECVLFGYSERHAGLGGLSWMRSSPVLTLAEDGSRALTESGRRYALGRRMEAAAVNDEGEEAGLAYRILVDGAFTGTVLDYIDLNFLAACKMARHLEVDPPRREFMAVESFMRKHRTAYIEARAVSDRQGGLH